MLVVLATYAYLVSGSAYSNSRTGSNSSMRGNTPIVTALGFQGFVIWLPV
jgi:hypothetical protein